MINLFKGESCRDMVMLMEKQLDGKLNLAETIKLLFHTSVCQSCNSYKKQSKAIDVFLKNHLKLDQSIPQNDINFKNRIITMIRKES